MNASTLSTPDANSVNSLSVFTLIIWLCCLLVGALGLTLSYSRPQFVKPQEPAVKVETLTVDLAPDVPPVTQPAPVFATVEPQPEAPPQVPQPTPVAQPSLAIAFALPVEGAVRIVEKRQAAFAPVTSAAPTTVVAPAPQPLIFGQGEGRQPAPEYPARARREGQEGVVTVRFTVAENGHVIEAEAATPSPWLLLNDAAVRVVKDRWHFPAGGLRVYEVAIRFELTKQN